MNNKYDKTADATINITSNTSTNDCVYRGAQSYGEPCSYRLPCGYCKILCRDCPKYYTTTWTTWTSSDPNIKVTL